MASDVVLCESSRAEFVAMIHEGLCTLRDVAWWYRRRNMLSRPKLAWMNSFIDASEQEPGCRNPN